MNRVTESRLSLSPCRYGALVVGGGKQTQKRARRVLPACDHRLFDVADDMPAARLQFREAFDAIGRNHPQHFDTIVANAARFMSLNNGVIVSVRTVPFWSWRLAAVTAAAAAVSVAVVRHNRRPLLRS